MMSIENYCPKFEKCPIFINNVLTVEKAGEAYKQLYCTCGAEKYQTCKRYEVALVAGKCPPNIMPNSQQSVEEIISAMNTHKS